MTKFNNKLFCQIIDAIVKKNAFFANRRVTTKLQLYTLIGEKMYLSPDTVRGWRKDSSSGPDPRNPELLRALEDLLGLREGSLLKTDEYIITDEVTKENKMNSNITDFQKIQIMECYDAMKKFVNNMNIEDEGKYYELRNKIEAKKLVLPNVLYESFVNFLDDVIEPYVFDDHTPEFTPDEAEYNGDGVLVIKSNDASKKMIVSFLNDLNEMNLKIECFAEEELKPYLWA